MKSETKTSGGIRRNLRLVVSYDGTDFHGWQRQPSQSTIQGCLEDTLARILSEPVTLFGSGRTDAGVHALGQVANFTTSCRIPCANLVKALNDLLPPSIRVRRAEEAPPGFHARYRARSKTYRYRILQQDVCSPFLWRFVWHYPQALDRRLMAEAASVFVGEHDFTSFAVSEAGEEVGRRELESMVRTVYTSRMLWRPRTAILTYEVAASGFLHHMVRSLVGTLVEVGRHKLSPQDVTRILQARDRALAGPTAPAQGLCLVRVEY